MAQPFALGVDLGASTVTTLAYHRRHGVLVRTRMPSRVSDGPALTLARMAAELKRVRALSEVPWEGFKAVGLGAPGPLDLRAGLILKTPNLKGWNRVPVVRRLSRALGLPVLLENDARCAAWAEHALGAGQGCRDMAMLTLGTGVGGGLILDGRLRRGPDGTAGELGFLYLDRHAGAPRANFGLPGSLEALASAPALAKAARAALGLKPGGPLWRLCQGRPARVDAAMVGAALRLGDPAAKAAWDQAGHALGLAAASLINALNLEALVIGGGVMAGGGRELLARVRRTAKAGAYPQAFRRCRISVAALGQEAGAIGAAELALGGPA
ncbi:MAG TPA: ROK family protein [bacterium]|jgi:glucokinase|nr:ROK family protein [bacterium]